MCLQLVNFPMDSAQLIVIVQEYEELYNLRHPDYSNQQRRDNIWEEIGRRMNHLGAICKSKWTRIRDNHRKALNLLNTKSGQAVSKMKPPKFHKELQFLTPYLHDDEDRMTNLTPSIPYASSNLEEEEDETQSEHPLTTFQIPPCSPATSDTQRSSFANTHSNTYGRRKRISRNSTPQPTAASVLDKYLKSKEMKSTTNPPTDPLIEFFINMARTVKTFPLQDQIHIKGQLFQMVNSVEMRLAQEMDSSNSVISSATHSPAQHQQVLNPSLDIETTDDAIIDSLLKYPR
ncbi:uncharacterized protein LOC117282911 [Cryptotermes secundus]|uniref:uncharacterized protein LOC117282911 n=1 Tax=Cryptotermes secundus TaxID=105785 RepID=UPI001454C6E1|nr:uncharacterized protein LOC117282911 [Cryptotermes secundus]